MKGIIEKDGSLWIERAGILVAQLCPLTQNPCNDRCPKFGEPYYSHIMTDNGAWVDGIVLRLCDTSQLFFIELLDKRGG